VKAPFCVSKPTNSKPACNGTIVYTAPPRKTIPGGAFLLKR
jgi:hypothetical protein